MPEPSHGKMFDEMEHGMLHQEPILRGVVGILLTIMRKHLGSGLGTIQELTINRVMVNSHVDSSSLILGHLDVVSLPLSTL